MFLFKNTNYSSFLNKNISQTTGILLDFEIYIASTCIYKLNKKVP